MEPIWFSQLKWEGPFPFHKLVDDATYWPGKDTKGSGLYAFTTDVGALLPGRVLYIGKSDGRTPTLRDRVGAYVKRFRMPETAKKGHRGMEMLYRYYDQNPYGLFIRWAGCVIARDLEGRLIDYYDPPMNTRQEAILFCDDELIPEEYL